MTKKASQKYRKNYTYKICTATPDTTKRLIYMDQKIKLHTIKTGLKTINLMKLRKLTITVT